MIEEIIGFITRVNTTANFVFDEEFSVELEHYCKELEFLVQTLQLTIDINRDFLHSHDVNKREPISMSAFMRASHRLRSMSLISGYLLSQKGTLLAKISYKSGRKSAAVSKWVTIIDNGEMNIVFHPRYRRFQLEIVSNEETKFSKPAKNNSKMTARID